LVEANDETRAQAGVSIHALAARGGTNLEEGLRFGLTDLSDPARRQLLVLLTDGEPTIGVTRPEDVLSSVRASNPQNRRIFVFAVGADLNAKLLDRLVEVERGAAEHVGDKENIELRLSSFYDKIDSPVLTSIRIGFRAGGFSDVYPRPFPDLFRGEQLAILGRFEGSGHKSVVVRGKLLGEERVFEYSLDFGDGWPRGEGRPSGERGHIARLWAARDALELSRELAELEKADAGDDGASRTSLEELDRGGVRDQQVDARTFYLQAERWIDAALTAQDLADASRLERMKYLLGEYFALLAEPPGIGRLLAVGPSVTFVWEGKVISVEA
jgi:hypothetical protein